MDTEKVYSIKHYHIDVQISQIPLIVAATGQKEDIRPGFISRAKVDIHFNDIF